MGRNFNFCLVKDTVLRLFFGGGESGATKSTLNLGSYCYVKQLENLIISHFPYKQHANDKSLVSVASRVSN